MASLHKAALAAAGGEDPIRTFQYQVGRFVLAFGGIEHTTYLCLDHLPAESAPGFARTLNLGPRLEWLIELLERRVECDEAGAAELLEVLRKVKQFAKDRNLIAHNTVMFSVFEQDGRITLNPEIVSGRDSSKRLSLAGTIKLADEAEKLCEELWECASPLIPRSYA